MTALEHAKHSLTELKNIHRKAGEHHLYLAAAWELLGMQDAEVGAKLQVLPKEFGEAYSKGYDLAMRLKHDPTDIIIHNDPSPGIEDRQNWRQHEQS